MFFQADTLDDLLRAAFCHIRERGLPVEASRGSNREALAVSLKLNNPLARLSHTVTKGKFISALGELAWYLAARNEASFMSYYLPKYAEEAEADGTVHGAYGPRLFGSTWHSQFNNVANLLRSSPSSRRAVIQLFDHHDLLARYQDIPCTNTLQFLIRGNEPRCLHLIANMRSNDAFKGLPHDVFSFTMLQEIMARVLDVEVGEYAHFAGSLHLYDNDSKLVEQFLSEGHQGRLDAAMPRMPTGGPWPSIEIFLRAEKALRTGQPVDESEINALDGYWRDLVSLFRVYRCKKDCDVSPVPDIRMGMTNRLYDEYIAGFE